MAIGAGLVGVLIILQPGIGGVLGAALLPLASAFMFALYSLLTRRATQAEDAFLSLFWSGIIGAVLITVIGLPNWEPMPPRDWAGCCFTARLRFSRTGCCIKCYEVAEASAVQPFAYLQIVFVSIVGILVFSEVLEPNVVLGAAIVVGAGLVALSLARSPAEARPVE